jgi:hypothetical protein
MIAPITLIELFNSAQKKKKAIFAIVLALIVFSGMTSTLLSMELEPHLVKNEALNSQSLQVVNALNNLPANKVLLTVTNSTFYLGQFAPSSWEIKYYRYQIWPAQTPELPLNALYSLNEPVCVLLQKSDLEEINQSYASGYLASHLLPILLPNNSSNATLVALLPAMSAPVSTSNTLLVLPSVPDTTIWYAYDILSQAKYNYSAATIDDIATISQAKTLIAPTEGIASQLIQYRSLFNLQFDKLIILNLGGYDELAANYFSWSASTTSATVPKVNVDEIIGSNGALQFNGTFSAIPLTTNKTVLAYYKGQNAQVPFIIEDNNNGFESLYVNVYPLTSDFQCLKNNYALLGNILAVSNETSLMKAKSTSEKLVQETNAAFTEADLEGNISISLPESSATVRSDLQPLTMTFNGKTISGISTIIFSESNFTLTMSNCTLNGGEGFYSYVYSNKFKINSTYATLGTALLEFDNSTERIVNIPSQEAEIIGSSVTVLRQPNIKVKGNAEFEDLYPYENLSKILNAFGKNTSFKGTIAFHVNYGNNFTITNYFVYNGQVSPTAAKYAYVALGSLPQTLPVLIIIILVAFVVFYMLRKHEKLAETKDFQAVVK